GTGLVPWIEGGSHPRTHKPPMERVVFQAGEELRWATFEPPDLRRMEHVLFHRDWTAAEDAGSELRDAGEGPAVDAQGGDHGRTEEALDRLARAAHRADARQRVEVRLREPQVPHRPDDLATLDQEGPVTGHAG